MEEGKQLRWLYALALLLSCALVLLVMLESPNFPLPELVLVDFSQREAQMAQDGPGEGKVVNLNTATLAELESLPGLGETISQRIIDYRTEYGPFRTVEELDEVEGIGPRTLEKLRPFVTVE